MNVSLESDLDEAIVPEVPKLTQADYDRAAKLNAGISKLQAELDVLKDRIRAEAPDGKSTKVFGSVVVKTSERNDKDIDALTDKFPLSEHPDYYKSVLDATKVPAPLLIFKPTIKVVSISFAE